MKKLLCTILFAAAMVFHMPYSFAKETTTYSVGALTVPYAITEASLLEQAGLFLGTESGYDLNQPVTRAQAVTMLLRLMGEIPEAAQTPFIDIQEHWAKTEISFAYTKGYVQGTGQTTFSPEEGVTGREFAKMLLFALGQRDVTLQNVYAQGVNTGLLVNNYTRTMVEYEAYTLNRSDMVYLCFGALHGITDQGDTLLNLLVEKGAVTKGAAAAFIEEDTPLQKDPALSFAVRLSREMPEDKNYCVSPLSIKMALAMLANGTAGATKQELLSALELEDLNQYNQQAQDLINSYDKKEKVTLEIANSIWLNSNLKPETVFAPEYEKQIKTFFSGVSTAVPEALLADSVNTWVKEKTHEKITEILKGPVNSQAILVNTLYFKGAWLNPFSKATTQKDTFTDRSGGTHLLDFMRQTDHFRYYTDGIAQMLALPYEDRDIHIYLLLDGELSEFDRYLKGMQPAYVDFSMPKFQEEFSTGLTPSLKAFGVKTVFDPALADLSPMFSPASKESFVSDVLHKTYIEVDENGTEAAAVTTIPVAGSAAAPLQPPEPVQMKLDHPFTYLIRDDQTGELLFIGIYAFAE